MAHSKIYEKYNSDSGDQDLSTEKIMPISFSFDDVLNYAIQLGAILIVKVNNRFYLKGLHHKFSYDEVKERIEENIKYNKFKTRKCYLIRYR
jgi:hypothetical protein